MFGTPQKGNVNVVFQTCLKLLQYERLVVVSYHIIPVLLEQLQLFKLIYPFAKIG